MQYKKILKDAIALFMIALVAGVSLSVVYEITKEPIAASKLAAKEKAYSTVYPEASKFQSNDQIDELLEKAPEIIQQEGYENVIIEEAFESIGNDGKATGVVMMITTREGYGGNITITLGVDNNMKITGMEILSITETAGLGMKAKDDDFKSQYKDRTVDRFTVVKSGSTSESEIDAISGATITSDAVTTAVNTGLLYIENYLKIGGK